MDFVHNAMLTQTQFKDNQPLCSRAMHHYTHGLWNKLPGTPTFRQPHPVHSPPGSPRLAHRLITVCIHSHHHSFNLILSSSLSSTI